MASNDVVIASGIFIFFMLTSSIVPIIEYEFTGQYVYTPFQNETAMQEEWSADNDYSGTSYNALNIASLVSVSIINLLQMLFSPWFILGLPWWLNLIIYPLKFVLWFIIFRNLWVGGGA